MFNQLIPLQQSKHSRLRYQPPVDFSFAKFITQVPVMAAELNELAKDFMIVFPSEGTFMPQALMGVSKDQNLFVGENGEWKIRRVPSHIRRYPFVLGQADDQDNLYLMIDEQAANFSDEKGELLFHKSGDGFKESPLLKRIKNDLVALQKDFVKTKEMFKALKDHDVLVSKVLSVETGGKTVKVGGLSIVDWQKVSKLDDAVIAEWVRSGLMEMIFSHLRSLKNSRALMALKKRSQETIATEVDSVH